MERSASLAAAAVAVAGDDAAAVGLAMANDALQWSV